MVTPRLAPSIQRFVAVATLAGLASLGAAICAGEAHAGPGANVNDATPAQKKDAQTHYEKGAKLYELKKFEDARASFQASYDVVKSPNAHLMLARSLIELGQITTAYEELLVAEEEAKTNEKYAATLEKIRQIKADVRTKIALVRVNAISTTPTAGLSARVDGKMLPLGEERAMMPGKINVEIVEGTTVKGSQQLDVTAGEQRSVDITLEAPLPQPDPTPQPQPQPLPKPVETSSSKLGYLVSGGVVAGLGVVAAGVGTGLYFMAKSDYDELVEACGEGGQACPEDRRQQIEDGRDKQAWAVISWVAGGATAALGVGLIIAGATRSDDAKSDDTALLVGPGYLGLKTRFE